ncbi:1784e81b-ecdc-4233-989d-25db7792550f [Thermothielavioides terrestris]|jgi:hypothetical protein|uniref:Ecp2 effector protein-like domain-containing protein n=2 Tax=Thermothielavioides terrestris TaxID=2587410 RepID=G2QVY0_THETT|nr:uncharacterized protein THITE_116253 [Thermothielavioides terrestris NRRL 8126]AEO64712.1 hypothetical protein THITE_116253 [Thermothielavioides terrestris NRRL 8126]SPQ26439.1 1784e81b-ecdc-4233-989d-25db7792550f [Thermothielavioides terrestris]
MPSLITTLLLVLAASFTLAAPTASPASPALLSKRATYHTTNRPTDYRDDYCGEATPVFTTPSNAPLVSDCLAIAAAYPGSGYWIVAAGETAASADSRWVTLAAHGSCAFQTRWAYDNDAAGRAAPEDYRFGTNDLRFYVTQYYTQHADQAVDGRLQAAAEVQCYTGSEIAFVEWRVASASS